MKSLSPTPLAKDLSLRGQDLDKQRLYNKVVASPNIERVGNSLIVKMHGVRGSIPQPKNTSKYGGNTSCYELVTDDFQIILDTGTGFQDVILDRQKTTIILYGHFHHDHIQGLPFNLGVFSHQEDIYLASGLVNRHVLKNLIQTYFSGGYFPVDIVTILKQLKFTNYSTLKRKLASKCKLNMIELNHPGGCMGYSFETAKGKFCYLLDNEYLATQLDSLLKFVKGSRLVLWDGMFTEKELELREGWGHSSIERACIFAEQADIRELIITHHSPSRTDDELDQLSKSLTSSKVSFAVQSSKVEF